MTQAIFRLRPKFKDTPNGPHTVSYGDSDFDAPDYETAKTMLYAIQDAHAGGYRTGRQELREELSRYVERFGL